MLPVRNNEQQQSQDGPLINTADGPVIGGVRQDEVNPNIHQI